MTTENTKNKTYSHFWVHVYIGAFLFMYPTAHGQVNTEAVAGLYFSIASEPHYWIEGYQSVHEGSYSPYQSHRSGVHRDSAFVARTSGGEATIEWNTAAIPQAWTRDSASFIWVCGFGNNLGNEWYDLEINDTAALSFSTKNDGYWSVTGGKGIRLSFTAVSKNSNGANLGYMVLSVHQPLVVKGKVLKIRIRGREANHEIWYRLFAYRDAVRYMLDHELRQYFSNIDFIHMGDATLTFCAPKILSGASLQLFTSNTLIAEGRLQSAGILAKASIVISRYSQPDQEAHTLIKVAGKSVDTVFWSSINTQRLRAFMEEEIECSRYVFHPGEFPTFHWKNEIMVENELGVFPLKAAYFNSDFQPVTSAGKPGRYGAVIEGVTPSGFVVKRYVTLFCSPVEFDDYSKNVPLTMTKLREYGIPDAQWDQYSKNEERYSFGSLKYFPQHNADAAVFLAGLNDMADQKNTFDTPRIRDRQWWITLKGKLEGKSIPPNPLMSPQKIVNDSSFLLIDTIDPPPGYEKEQIEKMRTVCRRWAEKGGVPHVTLVVHKGKIVFHEAFGVDEEGKLVAKDSRIWMASITKLLTGVLMMEFVDQGLVDLDAPVSRYLPELHGIGNERLTIRHLFTHTSGLSFAGEWASDWNPALENQIAQILPSVDVGGSFAYHRVGYALAGKLMERITGRAVPYLFQDYVFTPLGMKTAFSDNTYGGLYCSSMDLARFGQMLLNKGTYNGVKLFSVQTFETMLPAPLPVSDRRWGIGTTPMEGYGLSESAFGHGAASGTVFRVDPKNDLIIISARKSIGKYHDEFENAFIESCTSLIHNH